MKLLQINATYQQGSTGEIVSAIHNMALDAGIESHVAYSLTNASADSLTNCHCIGTMPEKKIHALLGRLKGKQAYYSAIGTKRFLKELDKLSPDIVHLHNLHSNYINLDMLLSYLAKKNIPTVITLHDCWFFTGGCFHYTMAGCCKWQENCGNCPKRFQDTKALLKDCSAQILANRKEYLSAIPDLTVVGVSNWISAEAGKSFLASKRIETLHNGVNTDIFYPVDSDFREKNGLTGRFVILGLASKWLLPENENVLSFILENLSEDEALVLLGCDAAYKKKAPDKIVALDFISDVTKLCAIYSSADVFVNCTREDSLAMVTLEAQSCGTPVITFDNTGVAETVDGLCGFKVPTGDAFALLQRIRLIKEKGKSTFSEACRNWIMTHFDRDANYKAVLELYQSILKDRYELEKSDL